MTTPEEEREKQARRDQIAAWLQRHWKNSTCYFCGSNNWQVGDVSELRLFAGGGLVIGGPLYPVAPVTCNVCGQTVLVNAVTAGALAPEQPTDENAPEGGAK